MYIAFVKAQKTLPDANLSDANTLALSRVWQTQNGGNDHILAVPTLQRSWRRY